MRHLLKFERRLIYARWVVVTKRFGEGVWRGTVSGKFSLSGRLDTDDGEVHVSMSAGLRDLEEVPEGTRVRITFEKWAVSKGGNEFRLFKVEQAAGGAS